ncbi:hypothetical protein TGGT1_260375 [Toxoplasma gondii GT1]|uniref:Uncharacterized protein n=1 Tax=Toxoplasma gondii (strain ATCC 50853 / GT1) TaxID=507601 RepID=S7UYN5_TOXGG|nr:hypothetical protein TGGT1_260375 [Toxoplasma gondii GT1]
MTSNGQFSHDVSMKQETPGSDSCAKVASSLRPERLEARLRNAINELEALDHLEMDMFNEVLHWSLLRNEQLLFDIRTTRLQQRSTIVGHPP